MYITDGSDLQPSTANMISSPSVQFQDLDHALRPLNLDFLFQKNFHSINIHINNANISNININKFTTSEVCVATLVQEHNVDVVAMTYQLCHSSFCGATYPCSLKTVL